jgi:hypothetical protein
VLLVDKIVLLLTLGYGVGAMLGLFFGLTQTLWQGLLVFWIGGAVATLVIAVVFKIWLGSGRDIRDGDDSANINFMRDAGRARARSLKNAANWGRGHAVKHQGVNDEIQCEQCHHDASYTNQSKKTSIH